MKSFITFSLTCGIFSSLLFTGCVTRHSGTTQSPSGMGLGQAVIPLATTGGGALIGKEVGGTNGAIYGGVIGAGVGIIGANAATNWHNNEIADAQETVRGEERTKVMRDYWRSHAIDGGNAPSANSSKNRDHPQSSEQEIEYPAGYYNGVYYGPRRIKVPVIQ